MKEVEWILPCATLVILRPGLGGGLLMPCACILWLGVGGNGAGCLATEVSDCEDEELLRIVETTLCKKRNKQNEIHCHNIRQPFIVQLI